MKGMDTLFHILIYVQYIKKHTTCKSWAWMDKFSARIVEILISCVVDMEIVIIVFQ